MGQDTDRTRPDEATREEERREAKMTAEADRMPTSEEEQAAERHDLDPDVAEQYSEATERGAKQRGEGRIEQ